MYEKKALKFVPFARFLRARRKKIQRVREEGAYLGTLGAFLIRQPTFGGAMGMLNAVTLQTLSPKDRHRPRAFRRGERRTPQN